MTAIKRGTTVMNWAKLKKVASGISATIGMIVSATTGSSAGASTTKRPAEKAGLFVILEM